MRDCASLVVERHAMPDAAPHNTETVPSPPAPVLEHREVLRAAILDLEEMLAAPSFGRLRSWCVDVATSAQHLEAAFADHVHLTEQPDGLYDDLVRVAPHLDLRLVRLRDDHVEIMGGLSAFLDSIDSGVRTPSSVDDEQLETWRREGTRLLGLLVRHRQRGINLTFEAFSTDHGGE